MNRLHFLLKRRLALLSRERIVGLGLLALCLAFYLSALRPTQVRVDQLQTNMVSLHEKMRNTAKSLRTDPDAPAEQLVTYYKFFPSQTTAPAWLDKIYKAALDQNLRLERADYRPTRDKAGKLIRYQITMPVKGSYLQLRKFLATVLTDVPIASLDHISFERQKIGDELIEAKVKLTLYLGQET
jgi:Tfp pilus assembly protein PilO